MIKTQLKLQRLHERFAQERRKQEARRRAHRKRTKADQQRARNKRKADERVKQEGLEVARQKSEPPAPISLLGCPYRDDPAEQKRAAKKRCLFDPGTGPETRTLAAWCDHIAQETGLAITAVDLWHLMTEERVGGIGEVLGLARSVSLR